LALDEPQLLLQVSSERRRKLVELPVGEHRAEVAVRRPLGKFRERLLEDVAHGTPRRRRHRGGNALGIGVEPDLLDRDRILHCKARLPLRPVIAPIALIPATIPAPPLWRAMHSRAALPAPARWDGSGRPASVPRRAPRPA